MIASADRSASEHDATAVFDGIESKRRARPPRCRRRRRRRCRLCDANDFNPNCQDVTVSRGREVGNGRRRRDGNNNDVSFRIRLGRGSGVGR